MENYLKTMQIDLCIWLPYTIIYNRYMTFQEVTIRCQYNDT